MPPKYLVVASYYDYDDGYRLIGYDEAYSEDEAKRIANDYCNESDDVIPTIYEIKREVPFIPTEHKS